MSSLVSIDLDAMFSAPRLDQQRRAIRLGAVLLPDETLEWMLRHESDATARNAALEMAKLRGARGRQLALRLLADDDPDVVLEAVLILDVLQKENDLAPLARIADCGNPNIAQAAIVAMGHSHNPSASDVIHAFTSREPWLQAAAIEALGALRDATAIPTLRTLTEDAVVGPLAVEAIARIGGQDALEVLSSMWLGLPRESPESEGLLEGIVSVAERAEHLLFATPRLRDELARRAAEATPRARELLVRARIALGRHEITAHTVDQFIGACGASPETDPLPASLRHHPELVSALLIAAPRWALALAAESADRIDVSALLRLVGMFLDGDVPDVDMPLLVSALEARDALPRGAAEALIGALESSNASARSLVRALLPKFAAELAPALERLSATPMAEHALMAAALPRASWTVATEIERLPVAERTGALLGLAPWPEAIVALPWDAWLDETPELLPVAARLSRIAPLPRLLPRFRDMLRGEPSPEIIAAVIASGETAGESILVEIAAAAPRDMLVEALGRCRGDGSLALLRMLAGDAMHPVRIAAMRALARRATAIDLPLFLDVVADQDWLVRHACVRALAHCPGDPRATDALLRLACDPVQLVAEGAVSAFEGHQ